MFRIASKKAHLLAAHKALKVHSKSLLLPSNAATACFSTNAASVPSVKDLLISLTFIDPSGARRKVTGLVGKKQIPHFHEFVDSESTTIVLWLFSLTQFCLPRRSSRENTARNLYDARNRYWPQQHWIGSGSATH